MAAASSGETRGIIACASATISATCLVTGITVSCAKNNAADAIRSFGAALVLIDHLF
jgi:hypothetical protein